MERLALAQTLVSGTVTLQGIPYSFSASGTGTATGNNVSAAKKSAITASNTAAFAAARIAVDNILLKNSAVLSDLEITSIISNNFSTTVEVFRPIALKSIANSSDGVNYTLKKNVTIGSNESLTISNGRNLTTGKYTLKNNGYVQVGEGYGDYNIPGTVTVSENTDNPGKWNVTSTGILTIDPGITFDQINFTVSENYLHNSGIITNNGIIINDTQYSNICTYSGSQFTNNGTITNAGSLTYIKNNSSAVFTNNGTITNQGPSTFILNNSAIFYNYGSIKNNGKYSYTCNSYGTWIGDGECTGNCCTSSCRCT